MYNGLLREQYGVNPLFIHSPSINNPNRTGTSVVLEGLARCPGRAVLHLTFTQPLL